MPAVAMPHQAAPAAAPPLAPAHGNYELKEVMRATLDDPSYQHRAVDVKNYVPV